MPDPETLDTRLRKRIVEFVISGFTDAKQAVRFGNTLELGVGEKIHSDELKLQLLVASPGTTIAITKEWLGPTVLKLNFLDVPDQNTAWFIVEKTRSLIRTHNEVRQGAIKIENEVVREKPQPQSLSITFIPRQSRVGGI